MSEGRRLKVLLSRQKQALVIFGDKDCVLPLVVGSKDEDEREANRRNTENRHLIKMLAWDREEWSPARCASRFSVAGVCPARCSLGQLRLRPHTGRRT